MSWNHRIVGNKEGLKEKIDADENVPQAIKDSIAFALKDFPTPDGTEILLETDGHFLPGQTYAGTCNVKISNVARAVVKVLLAFLACAALIILPARAAEVKPNRLIFTIGTASTERGDLLAYRERSKRYGAVGEFDAGEHAKLRFTVSRDESDARTWIGSVGPALHFGPLVFPLGGEWSQATRKWAAVGGAGLQKCGGGLCFEALARYHQGINGGGDNLLGVGTVGEAHFYSLDVGFGFRF